MAREEQPRREEQTREEEDNPKKQIGKTKIIETKKIDRERHPLTNNEQGEGHEPKARRAENRN
jgi:hypothetical protein